ncbi:MAG: hypothetical protein OHK0046_29500 [Anaerolineae bacterium]
MATITCREATEHDLTAIRDLIALLESHPDEVLTLEHLHVLFLTRPTTQTLYVAESDGVIVGTYTLNLIQQWSHTGGRSVIVEDVAVSAVAQGQGVGRAMMHHAVEQARALGCYKIVLSSALHRESAHAFYDSLGYERHGVSFRLLLK